ncbi:MAG: NAD(P)-dependent oxidoreductase, partial [Tissierellia bacterium]|nr:NAD(P)-dependent oxidoreductase [Tissierellia bacterium]
HGIAPGVFVIVTSSLPQVHQEMKFLKMGDGPNYVLYRPYHLTSLETPISIARAALYNEPTIAPQSNKLVAEVITRAKVDLKKGQTLDGIGEYTVYGSIDTYEKAKEENLLPIGLVNRNTIVKRDIRKGEFITYDMVELDKSTMIYKLRQLQD